MTKLHHNTAKKAKKFGLTVEIVENEFTVSKDGVQLASHASGSVAVDKAIEFLNKYDEAFNVKAILAAPPKTVKKARKVVDADEGDEGDEEAEDLGRSIVKAKYRALYKPNRGTCGDDLANQIRQAFEYKDEDGKRRIDMKRFVAFAKANEVWLGAYSKLSNGLARMNCSNRLRAKIRKGYKVVWE